MYLIALDNFPPKLSYIDEINAISFCPEMLRYDSILMFKSVLFWLLIMSDSDSDYCDVGADDFEIRMADNYEVDKTK